MLESGKLLGGQNNLITGYANTVENRPLIGTILIQTKRKDTIYGHGKEKE
jgi:hypothetical protein